MTIVPATVPTANDNDYTRINNAVQATFTGQVIKLLGTFNWTEPNAAASWATGSNYIAGDGDDYSILVPANRHNVTFTADNLGDATIQGPGDLAAVNLEGVLVFDGGDNQGWIMSNIRYLDFDLTIGMFNGAGGADAFNNTQIINNYIRIARDLNATVAPADVNQNIGIHYSFGTNQLISGNTIESQGDGVSAGPNFSSDVGMQSNTSGGNVYNGLQITNNTINILNAQTAGNPQNILGIWENGLAHTSNITVSGNSFNNLAAGNNPATNLQRAFRVTSHSSATTAVTYANNSGDGREHRVPVARGPELLGQPAGELGQQLHPERRHRCAGPEPGLGRSQGEPHRRQHRRGLEQCGRNGQRREQLVGLQRGPGQCRLRQRHRNRGLQSVARAQRERFAQSDPGLRQLDRHGRHDG